MDTNFIRIDVKLSVFYYLRISNSSKVGSDKTRKSILLAYINKYM
jgi:hypothetical protein